MKLTAIVLTPFLLLAMNSHAQILNSYDINNLQTYQKELGKELALVHTADLFTGLKGDKKTKAEKIPSYIIENNAKNFERALTQSREFDNQLKTVESKISAVSPECRQSLDDLRYAAKVVGFFSGFMPDGNGDRIGISTNYFLLPDEISKYWQGSMSILMDRALKSVRQEVDAKCAGFVK